MKRAMVGGVLVAMAALLSATSLAASASDCIKAGCPPPDRVWTGADYQKFGELVKSGKIELPMLSSDETRPFFLALVNREALSSYSNKKNPVGARFQECIQCYSALAPVLMKYLEQHNSGKADCSREMARLTAFVLHASTVLVNLTQEFLPTIPKDATYADRMAGLEQMKDGLRTVWTGAADSLAERTTYAGEEEVLIIAEAMIEELPAQSEFIGPAAVQALRSKIAGFLEKEKSDKIKAALQRLLMTCNSLAAP
jgi:hypothetical protein